MPAETVQFLHKSELLTYEEITKFVHWLSQKGITRLRLTGGEPLVRSNLAGLVAMLKSIESIESVSMTTNGMLLAEQIESLESAGLDQINISLDTLNETVFQRLSRRQGLQRVIDGIEAAIRCGYTPKLNAVLLRDVNYADVEELVDFALGKGLVLRFIEFMPLDSEKNWNGSQHVSGTELRLRLEAKYGALIPIDRDDPSRPAQDFHFANQHGQVGFIDSVSAPFCSRCDRLRLTAEGKLRNCLFGHEEWDIRGFLRSDSFDELESRLNECVQRKYAGHGIGDADFIPPTRTMHQIGG